MAEPVNTIGASPPTEPPKPIVIADANTDDQQLCAFKKDYLEEMAYNTLVIPCEILSFTTYFINKVVKNIPTTGKTRYNKL